MPDLKAVSDFFANAPNVPVQKLTSAFLSEYHIELAIKREDLLHPEISGNKWRKLKYNLLIATAQKKETILTFGGAYSNHIAAVAAAGALLGFKTVGFIRGEEHGILNPTLQQAKKHGMQFQYLDRETYRLKNSAEFQEKLRLDYSEAYIIPEGGTNNLAIKGTAEILNEIIEPFDVVCCAAGTGGTAAGLLAGLNGIKQLQVFSALKGDFLTSEINHLTQQFTGNIYINWQLQTGFHFGGYAKVKPELLQFIHEFEKQYEIPLEPVYTGKMFFGLFKLIKEGFFKPRTRILAIHTGGLQGLKGFQ